MALGINKCSFTISKPGRALIGESVAYNSRQNPRPIPPKPYLLSFGARTRLINHRHIDKPAPLLGELCRNLPIIIKNVAAQSDRLQLFGAKELEHRRSVGNMGAVEQIK